MSIKPYLKEQLWNPDRFPLPKRSYLHHLSPVGVGTPLVESLTSYLSRLADSHSVSLGVLVAQEIKAVVPKNYQSRDLFCIKDRTGTANGTGVIARDLVQALEQLTLREHLISLTLLKWSPVLSQRKLTRSVKPQLSALLRICHYLGLPLLTFLTEDNFKINYSGNEKGITHNKIKSNSPKFDLTVAEESLKLILSQSQDPPPSVTAVAKQLGLHRRTLTRRFPQLCQAISARYLEHRTSHYLEKMQQCRAEIEQAVIELRKQGVHPSESNVSKLVSQPGYFREQEVRAALKKARQEVNL